MSNENVEAVRRTCEAWERGDIEAWLEAFHPDIVWDTTHFEGWLEGAVYQGRDAVRFHAGATGGFSRRRYTSSSGGSSSYTSRISAPASTSLRITIGVRRSGLSSTIESAGLFVGPALGGLLLAVTDAGVVFAFTAGTLLWSALMS